MYGFPDFRHPLICKFRVFLKPPDIERRGMGQDKSGLPPQGKGLENQFQIPPDGVQTQRTDHIAGRLLSACEVSAVCPAYPGTATERLTYSHLLFHKFTYTGKQPVIVLRQHEAKTKIGLIRRKEGRTVTYHQPSADCHFKQSRSGPAIFQNTDEDEVCHRRICLDSLCLMQGLPYTLSMGFAFRIPCGSAPCFA